MLIFSKGITLDQHKEPALSGGLVRFVNLGEEFLNRPNAHDISELSAEEILLIAKEARIVDEQDGNLIYRKMQRAKGKAAIVIADAVDDEPYVSSKLAPALYLSDEMLGGLMLCQKVGLAERAIVMINKNLGHLKNPIPKEIGGVEVVRLQGGYPAQPTPGRLRLGPLPGRKMIISAGALVHLYRAATRGSCQNTAFITAAGNCVAHPMNLEVSIGMAVSQVLERLGLSRPPTRIVIGGPVTGLSIIDPDHTVITKTTRAVLAFHQNERDYNYSCIGCGRCETACPNGLNPMYIYRLMESSQYAQLRRFDAHLCIGCGACSYVCPSRLNLVGTMLRAKEYALGHFNPDWRDAR